MDKWKNEYNKNSLKNKISKIRDGLDERKYRLGEKRYYLVIKDENGKEVECQPITSKINKYGNEQFPKIITFPYLPEKSVVLTDSEFKEIIDRKIVIKGLTGFKLKNVEEIYIDIEERNN